LQINTPAKGAIGRKINELAFIEKFGGSEILRGIIWIYEISNPI
jgi:hypothetical protein